MAMKDNWPRVRLGDIGTISGSGVDKKIYPGEKPITLLNYLDAYHNDVVCRKDLNFVVSASDKQIKQCSVEKGDIFFTPTSETPDDIARCCTVAESMPDVVYSYHIVRLRPQVPVDSLFLVYACSTPDFRMQTQQACVGSGTRYVITLPKFKDLEISLPSLAEQKRIAGALGLVDGYRVVLSELREKYEAMKRAMVKKLLSPKPSWKTTRLGDVADFSTATVPGSSVSKDWYIGTENMLPNLGGVCKNTLSLLPTVRQYKKGDILLSNIRPYLKKMWLADKGGGCSTDVHVIRKTSADVRSDYLYFALAQDSFFRYVSDNAIGTKMPRGDKKVIKDFEFSLPSLSEQEKIVQSLEAIDGVLLLVEAECEKAESLKRGLMKHFFG
jgi:restriction endonuclease S subunit